MPAASNSSWSQSSTSTSLLERAKQHDQGAWETLVSLYAPLVYRECRVLGVSAQESPDIVQNVFRKVASNLHRFRHDRSGDTFRGWLATIARNCIRDHFRVCNRQPNAVGGTDMYRIVQEIPADELTGSLSASGDKRCGLDRSKLRRAVEMVRADFEPHTWQAFWKTAVEGLSVAEVAEHLGISKAVVYTARSRVVRRLREFFEGLE